jgi:hypothetical protein
VPQPLRHLVPILVFTPANFLDYCAFFLVDFNETSYFLMNIRKSLQINLMKCQSAAFEMLHAEKQTDRKGKSKARIFAPLFSTRVEKVLIVKNKALTQLPFF